MPEYHLPSLRLALGLGDQDLEQRLRPALERTEDLQIVAQCLAADQLIPLVTAGTVDALVLAWSLHRLTDAVLDQLERPGLIIILLVPDPDEDRWLRRHGPVLPISSDAEAVHHAVLSARPGVRRMPRPVAHPEPVTLKPVDRMPAKSGGVVAVTGGAGSPGRTTLAISIAAALGAAAPTALVELDLCAPALAAFLDLDPSRNICTLAHAVRDDPRAWAAALADELQPLVSGTPNAVALCGPPKREMRASIGPALVERLVDELAQRYQWVILDVGPKLLGVEVTAASHRAALARAQDVLLVSASDFVGLWHTRTQLDQLERMLGIERQKIRLILNRHDQRFHHSRQEVEWHLAAPVVSVIPLDHSATQRAISDQHPLVLDASSRAGRALLRLAESLNQGKLYVPQPGSVVRRKHWLRRWFGGRRQQAEVRPFEHVEPMARVPARSSGNRA